MEVGLRSDFFKGFRIDYGDVVLIDADVAAALEVPQRLARTLPRRADPLQALLHQVGRLADPLARGGHAGLRDQRFEIVDEARVLFGEESIEGRHDWHSHTRLI